jgi:uncharacterized protein (TIGR00159 family)
VVLAAAFYILLLWARQAQALRTALVIIGLRAGALLAERFELVITSWVLNATAAISLVLLLVVFQAELRYALLRLENILRLGPRPGAAFEAVYRDVATSAFHMAAERIGALVVITRKDNLNATATGGVRMNAEVSKKLLEAVFKKDSPLHDGAVVIDGDHILRANSILPLSNRQDLPPMYGTRHRSAMGMAERTDALVVVVSEERGEVTLMHDREARMVTDAETLERLLNRLHARPPQTVRQRVRGMLFANLGFKTAAVAMAGLIWAFSLNDAGATIRTVPVQVEFVGIPRGLDISEQSTDHLTVQLRGKAWMMDTIGVTRMVARFNLSASREGSVRLPVQADALNLPPGVVLERVTPPTVQIRLRARAAAK